MNSHLELHDIRVAAALEDGNLPREIDAAHLCIVQDFHRYGLHPSPQRLEHLESGINPNLNQMGLCVALVPADLKSNIPDQRPHMMMMLCAEMGNSKEHKLDSNVALGSIAVDASGGQRSTTSKIDTFRLQGNE